MDLGYAAANVSGQKGEPQNGAVHVGCVKPTVAQEIGELRQGAAVTVGGKDQRVDDAVQETANKHCEQGCVFQVPAGEAPEVTGQHYGNENRTENVDHVNTSQGCIHMKKI